MAQSDRKGAQRQRRGASCCGPAPPAGAFLKPLQPLPFGSVCEVLCQLAHPALSHAAACRDLGCLERYGKVDGFCARPRALGTLAPQLANIK